MDERALEVSKPVFLVYIIDNVELGQAFPRHHWPLHISLVPWFVTAKRTELHDVLSQFLATVPAFTVQVGDEALFGETHHAKVNVIEPNQQLHSLHISLLSEVEKLGTIISDKQYVRENYRGHITHYFERHKEPGERFLVDHIYLAELIDDDHCMPLERYDLKAEVGNEQ